MRLARPERAGRFLRLAIVVVLGLTGGTGPAAASGEADAGPVVAAEVILRSASGAVVDGGTAIVAENIRDYMPSEADVAVARDAFAARGFEVGPAAGLGFAISAAVPVFESVFRAEVRLEDGQPGVATSGDPMHLPLDSLPAPLAERVLAVTFTPAAELFGPGEP